MYKKFILNSLEVVTPFDYICMSSSVRDIVYYLFILKQILLNDQICWLDEREYYTIKVPLISFKVLLKHQHVTKILALQHNVFSL